MSTEPLNSDTQEARQGKFFQNGEQKELARTKKFYCVVISLLCVAVLGILDRLENHYLSLLIFYLLPIAFATWQSGRYAGYAALFLSSLAWLYDDVMTSRSYLRPDVPYWDIATKIAFCFVFINILRSLKRALDTEKKYARIDYLTETANRRYFFDIASIEISRARRHNYPLTLAYLDLDNFKYVNDHYGHKTGDRVLVLTSSIIKESLRGSDLVARVGGDEFAILLTQTDQAQAQIALNRLRQNVLNLMQRYNWPVTFSMGVITCMGTLCSFDTLMTKADDLMYQVKRSGKNTIKQALLEAGGDGVSQKN
jgi:diguanylate cyclase (GGDEF)-like protein